MRGAGAAARGAARGRAQRGGSRGGAARTGVPQTRTGGDHTDSHWVWTKIKLPDTDTVRKARQNRLRRAGLARGGARGGAEAWVERAGLVCCSCRQPLRPPSKIWQCYHCHNVCQPCHAQSRVPDTLHRPPTALLQVCPVCRLATMGRNTAAENIAAIVFSQTGQTASGSSAASSAGSGCASSAAGSGCSVSVGQVAESVHSL